MSRYGYETGPNLLNYSSQIFMNLNLMKVISRNIKILFYLEFSRKVNKNLDNYLFLLYK